MATQAPKRNDMFAQLARQSTGAKIGILVVAMLLLGLIYWQFFYKDLVAERDAAKKSGEGLQAAQRDLDKRIDALAAQKKKICGGRPDCVVEDQLKKEIGELSRALPAEAERNAFLSTLQTKADDAGVTFKGWGHLAELAVDKYIKVPMSIEVEGTFYQLVKYFSMLAPPPAEPSAAAAEPSAPAKIEIGKREKERIITIENLSIAQSAVRNDEIVLVAKFTAAAFRQEDQDRAKPAAGAGKPPAAGAKPPAPPAKPSLLPGQNLLEEEKRKNPGLFEPNL